jgi:alcohol dehydrogenase
MKIKAAVLERSDAQFPYVDSKPLVVQEIDLDDPGRDEVMVRIKAAGVCHSDLSVINGTRPRPVPMVLGHEAAGIVEKVGPGVTDLQPGDHVMCVFVPSCGHCTPCATGRPALCEPGAQDNGAGDLLGGHRRLSRDGESVAHHIGVSAFAEYATLSRRSVVPVDKDIPLHIAALFSCAALTGVGAVMNTAQVAPGSSVAVIGLGGVGLSSVLGAVASGAGRVIAIDMQQDKIDMAKDLGATDGFLATDPDIVDKIREATGGGVDYAIELAGAVPALELAYTITKRGGVTVSAGLPHPDAKMALPALSLIAEERTLKGSYLGSCVPSRDLPRMVTMYKQGILPVDKLLTHRMKLEDINLAMDQLHTGEAIRQIIDL